MSFRKIIIIYIFYNKWVNKVVVNNMEKLIINLRFLIVIEILDFFFFLKRDSFFVKIMYVC